MAEAKYLIRSDVFPTAAEMDTLASYANNGTDISTLSAKMQYLIKSGFCGTQRSSKQYVQESDFSNESFLNFQKSTSKKLSTTKPTATVGLFRGHLILSAKPKLTYLLQTNPTAVTAKETEVIYTWAIKGFVTESGDTVTESKSQIAQWVKKYATGYPQITKNYTKVAFTGGTVTSEQVTFEGKRSVDRNIYSTSQTVTVEMKVGDTAIPFVREGVDKPLSPSWTIS